MSARRRALVVLNPAAGGGRAGRRFHAVRRAIEERFEGDLVETDDGGEWRWAVERALRDGIRCFVAAGGDGTVGALVDALCAYREDVALESCTLGAVGLGSSNDYHKPVRTRIAGVPVRLNIAAAAPRDVGRVVYEEGRGGIVRRAFVVSAAVGVTAAGNAFFNHGDRLLRALKPRWAAAAVFYAALHELARGVGVCFSLQLPEARLELRAVNLSVLKTPHLAGSLRYDTPVPPDDGQLAVNVIEGCGRAATLSALARLARGRFLGTPGACHWRVREVGVDLASPSSLEIDGEVVAMRRARFDVLPEKIRACA